MKTCILTHKNNLQKVFGIFFLLLSYSVFAGGSFKGVTEIEGGEFEIGEEFIVSYKLEAKGSYSLNNPQFSLNGANFNGLDVIRQGQDRSFSFGFGDNAVFIYKYVLKGNKTGVYSLPAITIQMNGTSYPTQNKKVTIVKKTKETDVTGDLMLQLKSNKTSVFVGEPIRYDLHWYSSYQARGFQLKELPKFDGFIVESLESKTKTKIKTIKGKKYLTAKSYSFILIPIKAGSFKLPVIKGDIYLTTGRGFFQQTEPREITSKAGLYLKVKPLPTPPKGIKKPILVGKFKLKTRIDKQELNVNDAVTIRLSLNGSGNLNALSDLKIDIPSAFETLPTTVKNNVKTDLSGIHGSKTFEFIAIPRQPGSFNIPSIKISAFNPQQKKYYDLISDPLTVKVNGSSSLDANPYASSGSKNVEIQGSDIRYINEIHKLQANKKYAYTSSILQYWLLAISLLSFVFGSFAFNKKLLSKRDIKSNQKSKANRVAKKLLKNARKELQGDKNKFYELVDNALNNYLLGKLMIEQSELKQETITNELKKQNISKSLIDETLKIASDCKMARFSPLILAPKEMLLKAEKIINELENQLK
jgi:hypothetical protein